jgi:hypothetical protein
MQNRAAWLAQTEGRRIGNLDHVVNNVLKPRERLTGAGQAAPLTFRKNTKREGRELKGETMTRTNIRLPTAGSPEVLDAEKQFQQGKLGPQFTEQRINSVIEKAQGTLTRGQAIIVIKKSLRAIEQRKQIKTQREGFKAREGAREDVRKDILGPLKQQGQ